MIAIIIVDTMRACFNRPRVPLMSVQQADFMAERSGFRVILDRYLRWQAYHHAAAEWVVLLLFFSGLLLWERLPVAWPVFRWSLILHLFVGLIVFPLTTGLFWWSHRKLFKSSCKRFLRITGELLDWLLLLCFGTGFILAFWGATGSEMSHWLSDIHWITGLLMGPLMVRHAWRYTVLRLFKRGQRLNGSKGT